MGLSLFLFRISLVIKIDFFHLRDLIITIVDIYVFCKFNKLNNEIMKAIVVLSIFVCSLLLPGEILSQDSTLAGLKFFKIYVTTSDDNMFTVLQDEMQIDPKLSSYSIYVDLRSEDPQKHCLYLGDMNDPSAMKFNWSQFSDNVRMFLINWIKPNKMEPDK